MHVVHVHNRSCGKPLRKLSLRISPQHSTWPVRWPCLLGAGQGGPGSTACVMKDDVRRPGWHWIAAGAAQRDHSSRSTSQQQLQIWIYIFCTAARRSAQSVQELEAPSSFNPHVKVSTLPYIYRQWPPGPGTSTKHTSVARQNQLGQRGHAAVAGPTATDDRRTIHAARHSTAHHLRHAGPAPGTSPRVSRPG